MPKQGVVKRALSSASYAGHPNSQSTEEDMEVSQPSSLKVVCFPFTRRKALLFKILKITQKQILKDGVGFLLVAALAENGN